MIKLSQVLKLRCHGQSKLHLSTSISLSRNNVKKYLNISASLKTTWEEVSRLTDNDLDELFCKKPVQVVDEYLVTLYAFFKGNDKRLQRRGVTLLRLRESYQIEHPGGFSRTTSTIISICGDGVQFCGLFEPGKT